ncbi:MAG TPA: hypothetical protein VGF45_02860 [Polyangia bacterium]
MDLSELKMSIGHRPGTLKGDAVVVHLHVVLNGGGAAGRSPWKDLVEALGHIPARAARRYRRFVAEDEVVGHMLTGLCYGVAGEVHKVRDGAIDKGWVALYLDYVLAARGSSELDGGAPKRLCSFENFVTVRLDRSLRDVMRKQIRRQRILNKYALGLAGPELPSEHGDDAYGDARFPELGAREQILSLSRSASLKDGQRKLLELLLLGMCLNQIGRELKKPLSTVHDRIARLFELLRRASRREKLL